MVRPSTVRSPGRGGAGQLLREEQGPPSREELGGAPGREGTPRLMMGTVGETESARLI